MIYNIYLDGQLFSGMSSGLEILSGKASLELNGAGTCTIKIPYNHQFYDLPKVNKSIIDIYENDKIVWTGRVSAVNTNWNKEKTIEAEGALSYFNDSIQRPYTWTNEPLLDFLQDIIDYHNNSGVVPSDLQIKMGTITVTDVNVTKSVKYAKTFEVLQEQCIGAHGGYMSIRKAYNDDLGKYELYLDWLSNVTSVSSQPVQFGLNLLDISTELSNSDIITRIIPISETDEGTITINSATDNPPEGYSRVSDMLICDAAEEIFGAITDVVTFDGVMDANTLLHQAVAYLKSKQFEHLSIECDVAELSYLKQYEYTPFELGDNVSVISRPHFMNTTLVISKMEYDLLSASKKVTMGNPPRQTISEITGTGSGGNLTGTSSGSGGGGGGGGGGSTVSVTPIVLTGTDIATINVNGRDFTLKWNSNDYYNKSTTDTKIADYTKFTQTLQTGLKIAEIELGGNKTDIFTYAGFYYGGEEPSNNFGEDGTIYVKCNKAIDDPAYINPNYTEFSLDFDNWVYDYSDRVELFYKMNTRPNTQGDWPYLFGTRYYGGTTPELALRFNLWSGRRCINVNYYGQYTGDGYIGYESPFDYDNFYALVMDAGSFKVYKDADLNNLYDRVNNDDTPDAYWTATSGSGTTNRTMKLFDISTSGAHIDANVYRFRGFNSSGDLIHDYYPEQDGFIDLVDETTYQVESTGHIYHEEVFHYVLEKIYYKIDGIWNPYSSDVIANPLDTATDTLSSIEIDGTVYDISGSGITVVANPSGTATADLDTVQIGNIIYDIPGSGGGGSGKGYTSTLLWDYEEDNSGVIPYDAVTLTLRSSIDNFDTLVVEVVSLNSDISSVNWNATFIAEIDINSLKNSYNNNYVIFNSHGDRTSRFHIEGTTFQKTINNIANTNGIVRVYGIKFTGGSGGGGTPFSEETIYENTNGVSGAAQNIEITKELSNFDAVSVVYSTSNDGGYNALNESYYLPVFLRSESSFYMVWYPSYGNRWINLTGDPESTTVSLATGQYGEAAGYTPIVYEIRGVKYGSGSGGGSGTDVEANPSDPATDTLNTIKIGNTVYDIEGSGGGSGTVDTLYKAQSTAPPQTITFDKSVEDYDFLITHIKSSNASSATIGYTYTVDALASGNIIGGELAAGNGWIWYTYTDNTTLTYLSNQSNYYIDEISGVTIGGGASKGSVYVEESIYSASARATTMNLANTIDRYDAIEIEVSWMYNSQKYQISEIVTTKRILNSNAYSEISLGINVYRYITLAFTDNETLSLLEDGSSGLMYVSEIKGIKYGSSSSNEGIEYPTGELIQIPAGDDTTSRTFSFDRAPKRITATWNNSDGSWIGNWNFVWGDSHVMYLANTKTTATSGDYGGIASITYGTDGKSFTITGANAFGAMNDSGSGTMYVDYGIGTSGSIGAVSEVITMWNTHIADGDTIGFVLNKKYNNPYVIATNVLPKTSWGGLVVVDEAYGVTYDKNDNTLSFKVYTNSAQNYDIKWLVFDLDNDDYQKGSIYSTDEKIIGKWIDGSTLYQKTIDTGQLPNNTTKAVAHNITNIKKIIEISGYSTDGTNFGTLPYAGNNGWSITLYANDTNVYIASKNDFSTSTESYVTLKYIKL